MRALVLLLAFFVVSSRAESVVTPLRVPPNGKAGFTRLAPHQTGIAFTNFLADASVQRNRIYEIGSGVALGDVDNDGLCDIYLSRLEGDNVLYRNRGDWKFDADPAGAISCPGQYSTGAVFADVDRDNDLDLLVTGIGVGTRLFLNDGNGVFRESPNSGLIGRFGATSMTLADIEADGDLDLYVANYRTTTIKDNPNEARPEARNVDGRIVVTPEDRFEALVAKAGGVILLEKGEPDILYLNDGRGHFSPVSWTDGTFLDQDGKPLRTPPRDWGLSAAFRDLDQDGLPDLYVCNDFFQSPDRIWINEGGVFKALNTASIRTISMSSMSVDFADINRDGRDDIFVADMLSPRNESRQRQRGNFLRGDLNLPFADPYYRAEAARNTLFLNRRDGTYAEIAQLAGIDASEWTWSSVFMDVDLDGFEDLLLSTGNNHDVLDADSLRALQDQGPAGAEARRMGIRAFPKLELPSFAFRNNGNLTFSDASAAWGFESPAIAHGMAAADLDNDGDLDLVVNQLNTAAAVYRNNASAPRILVRVKGGGVGARIKVNGASQVIAGGGRYLSGDAQERMFAASEKNAIRAEFFAGKVVVVNDVPANSLCVIDPMDAKVESKPRVLPKPLFVDVKDLSPAAREALENYGKPSPATAAALKQTGFNLSVPGPVRLLPARDALKPVTGAIHFDTDGDGDLDLAVAREWSSPALFINDAGALKDQSAQWGVTNLNGWWTGIASGDFNHDGKIDLVIGNWGRNTKFQNKRPVKAYYSDLNGDGTVDVVEAWTENGRLFPVRDLDSLSQMMPDLRERFPTYRSFGAATIEEILGPHAGKMRVVTADTFDSVILLNRGNRFEAQPLPIEAQFSPVMSIATGDFNTDGKLDLFLGQNHLEGDQENSRHDAGAGLILHGRGDGTFRPLSPMEAGMWIYGETQAAVFGDGVLSVREKNAPARFFSPSFNPKSKPP